MASGWVGMAEAASLEDIDDHKVESIAASAVAGKTRRMRLCQRRGIFPSGTELNVPADLAQRWEDLGVAVRAMDAPPKDKMMRRGRIK